MQHTPKEATLLDSLMSNSIFEESTWSKGTESNKEIKINFSVICAKIYLNYYLNQNAWKKTFDLIYFMNIITAGHQLTFNIIITLKIIKIEALSVASASQRAVTGLII